MASEGRRELRWALVEAAQMAVKSDPLLKQCFQEFQHRMHHNQAIVAIAHRLLELVWYVLTRHEPFRHFSEERIAYKYLSWAWRMSERARGGLTRQQFARYFLTLAPPATVRPLDRSADAASTTVRDGRAGVRLGSGNDLKRVALDPKHPGKLASEAEPDTPTGIETHRIIHLVRPIESNHPSLRKKQSGGVEGCPQVENHDHRKEKPALKDENSEPFSFHNPFSVFLLPIS